MFRKRNDTRIVRTLWQYPNLSRIELSNRLGLDKSTITVEISRLIENGVVEELPEGPPSRSGGRKPTPLAIRKEYGYIIGISIQCGHYTAVAVNLAGEFLETKEEDVVITKDNLALNIQLIYWEFRDRLSSHPGVLLGIGIGVGGLIDPKAGTIRFSVPLDITEPFNIVDMLSSKLDVPFAIENNANCCAWGELAFHKNTELKNMLFALVEFKQALVPHAEYGGVGVGFGLVLNGKVHYGSNYSAGEFRSVLCTSNDDIQVALSRDELSRILDDPSVFSRFADDLARNMAMLVNTLDCGRVFIGGDIESCGFDFCRILEKSIEANWIYPIKKRIEIHYSSLGAQAVAFGAAGMCLQSLFAANTFPVRRETDA
jgi:predicted NBD/HSP70 family sugar kinase